MSQELRAKLKELKAQRRSELLAAGLPNSTSHWLDNQIDDLTDSL